MRERLNRDFLDLGIGWIILSVILFVFVPRATAKVWNGTAEIDWYFNNPSANTYTITTAEELAGLAELVNIKFDFSGKTVKLGTNIVLNENVDNWQNWNETNRPTNEWIAIGINWENSFKGTFDGDGHTISGVYINISDSYQGLFGYLGTGGVIKNLGVAVSYIKGGSYVGGLVGQNYYGTVSNSYATGAVTGTHYVGGLVGYNNSGTVSNSYATGAVSGSGDFVGGLVGYSHGTVSNSYYDSETSLQTDVGKGVRKTTAEMKSQEFVNILNLGAYSISMNAWVYEEGKYPELSNTLANSEINIVSYFASGEGTEDNPYIITTKEHLDNLSLLVNAGKDFNGEYFKLGNDIALNNTIGWQNWGTTPPANSWTAIGNINNRSFSGTFDGNGYVVSGVYINSTNRCQGLFGYSTGTIKNVGVVDSYINGGYYVGGLVGNTNFGTVSNSYTTGTVTGTIYVGGLAGYNSGGTISNSYSTGSVTGSEDYIGGLVGFVHSNGNIGGTVTNSYATGAVSGNGQYVGGLVGYGGIVSNGYYDNETSGQTDIGKGVGKTTAEIQSNEFVRLLNAGATSLSMNAWVYSAGEYPTLSNVSANNEINIASYFASGDGTSENPYIITTKEHLDNLSLLVNAGKDFNGEYFKLGNDIALNNTIGWQNWGTTPPANSWTAIGNINNRLFSGTFDGNGYVVSGVYINTTSNSQGLFGSLGSGGVIKNVGVVDSYINGGYYVGGLVGYNGGTVSNSYATGMVTGNENVGVLVGFNSRTISNSYATSAVSGTSSVGGLVGSNYGTVSNSYYDSETSGQTDTGKGEGKTTVEMKLITTYVDWDFRGIWAIDNTVNNGYPYFNIRIKTPIISDLAFTIPTDKVYNGTPQSIGTVTGADGMGAITIKYNGSETVPTNAGTYAVTAHITEGSAFTAATIPLGNFIIAKAHHDIDHITFEHKTVTHNGEEHNIYIVGELPEGVEVEYINNGQSEIDEHYITAVFTSTDPNYHDSLEKVAKLTITAPTPTIQNRVNPLIGGFGVQTISGGIMLTNLPTNAKVEVYNLNGKRIHSVRALHATPSLSIPVQTRGVYVVKVGGQAVRVVVR